MKKACLILSIACTPFLYGKGVMTATKETHDFGEIKEIDGPVSCKFEFENTGTQPIIIETIIPSCGCTSPVFSKQPIPPGKKGFIDVVYNPANKGGRFRQQIVVQSNASEPRKAFFVTGTVIRKNLSQVDRFPMVWKNIRLTTLFTSFLPVLNTEAKNDEIRVWNYSKKTVALSASDVPKFLQVSITPERLAPKQEASISITCFGKDIPDWGVGNYSFILKQDDAETKITVNTLLQEDFSKMTDKQLADAPEISVSETAISSSFALNEEKRITITVRNNGNSPLIIRKIDLSSEVIKSHTKIQPIPSKGKLDFSFSITPTRRGFFFGGIGIVSNSPAKPRVNVRISGQVK